MICSLRVIGLLLDSSIVAAFGFYANGNIMLYVTDMLKSLLFAWFLSCKALLLLG